MRMKDDDCKQLCSLTEEGGRPFVSLDLWIRDHWVQVLTIFHHNMFSSRTSLSTLKEP